MFTKSIIIIIILGVHISEDLSWTLNTSTIVKKAHQRLFFLRRLKKVNLSSQILVNFYRCTIESILTNCITVWYDSCSVADRKGLQRVVKNAQRITDAKLHFFCLSTCTLCNGNKVESNDTMAIWSTSLPG